MPMVRKLYPPNWEEIALEVKTSAEFCCESCGKECLGPGEAWVDFLKRMNWPIGRCLEEKMGRYVLTTAHLNHRPDQCDRDNLRAWCNCCHGRYDLQAIPLKIWLRAERNGQLSLFDLSNPTLAGHGKRPDRIQLPIRVYPFHGN